MCAAYVDVCVTHVRRAGRITTTDPGDTVDNRRRYIYNSQKCGRCEGEVVHLQIAIMIILINNSTYHHQSL